MHTLISFLGTGRRGENGYRKAHYQFDPQSSATITTQYFGLALANHIKPDHLVVLGTASSMWDVFSEHFDLKGVSEQIDQVMTAVEAKQVSDELLQPLAHKVGEKLGHQVTFAVIPYGSDTKQQVDILQVIHRYAQHSQSMSLDITHSFRHLPMLSFGANMYLRQVHQLSIKDIYYGVLELSGENQGITPVYRLDGLVAMADWTEALSSYDRYLDFGVFVPLLKEAGADASAIDNLEQAAFYERTHQLYRAKNSVKNCYKVLESSQSELNPLAKLFLPALLQRLKPYKTETLAKSQQRLGWEFFKKGNYFRGALLLQEAFLTRLVEQSSSGHGPLNAHYREDREPVEAAFLNNAANGVQLPPHIRNNKTIDAYKKIKKIRNSLAHGTKSSRNSNNINDIDKLLNDPQKLESELTRLINILK